MAYATPTPETATVMMVSRETTVIRTVAAKDTETVMTASLKKKHI